MLRGTFQKMIQGCFSLMILFSSLTAHAAPAVVGGTTALKQIQISGGNRIDLLFDREIDSRQIKTEFYQEIIQISLNNVSVYPPKIFSVNGSDVSKVFAYQYTPKLVRCRLTVKGKAEDFKERVTFSSKGRVLTLTVNASSGSKDQVTLQAAKAVNAPVNSAEPRLQNQDKTSLEKISEKIPEKISEKNTKNEAKSEHERREQSLTGRQDRSKQNAAAKPLSGIVRTFGILALLLVFAAGFFVGIRRLLKGKVGSKSWLARAVRGKFGVQGKMIDVIATHYLGPKKSIAVVKIQGRQLVLGITDESINLISQMDMDEPGEDNWIGPSAAVSAAAAAAGRNVGAGAISAGAPRFSDVLNKESYRPEKTNHSVRDQIRKRVEGLKNL